MIKNVKHVNAVRQHLFFNMSLNACAGTHCLEFYSETVGKLTPFGEKFKTYLFNGSLFYFAIYKYVVHIGLSLSYGMVCE